MSTACPHCRASSEPSGGRCSACGGAFAMAIEPGVAREFGGPSDVGLRLDDGSTACPVAFGPYRVLGLIGKGGMGLVYHAIHEVSREEVAVKTVRVRKRGMLHRIRREIHALARIRHPGLVRIIETGQSDGLPWYAMELLRGQSLQDRMARDRGPSSEGPAVDPSRSSGFDTNADFILVSDSLAGESAMALPVRGGTTVTVGFDQARPSPEVATDDEGRPADFPTHFVPATGLEELDELLTEAMGQEAEEATPRASEHPPELIPEGERREFLILMARLCETLAYLHGEGIVHRDIKPQNVIIRPDGSPVLLDFGLASRSVVEGRETLELSGTIEGTPEYMSPEQIRGEYVDARADLYAVGCILYEGVTGRVPFRGKTPGGTLRAHLKLAPATPRSIRADIPEALDELILHLMAKEAGERLGYARDIIACLDGLACGSPGWGEVRPSRDYLYRPGFVGRGSSLVEAEAQIRRAQARPGHCIFLHGQTGVGKTRFIMELARRLQQGGLTVATGECLPIGALADDEGGGPSVRATPLHPFRPFLQMVADCCLERGCEEVARLLGPGGGVLALTEPSLANIPGAPEGPGCPEGDQLEEQGSLHSRLIEALGETLSEFGRTSPVVVFLDDLEWADALTLHFLALYHVGVWDRPGVAIVAAYRTEGEEAAIRDYRPVFRDGTFLEIGPLESASLGEIVRGMLGSNDVDDRFVEHLARRSGGNPFFVAEFLRAAVTEKVLHRDPLGCWRLGTRHDGTEALDAAIGLPDSLHGLVVRRLSGLSDDARRLLELAAVVGREVDADLLESVEPLGEARTLAALASLLVAQVLEEGRDGHFRFSHDKLREVAYEQIPPLRRCGLHRSVALAIEASLPSRLDRSRHSNTLAHHWFRSIADRLVEPDSVDRSIEYLETSIRLAVNAGLPGEAVDSGRAAAQLLGVELPESLPETQVALAVEIGAVEGLMGSRSPENLLELPASTDPAVDRVVELLLSLEPPAFLSHQISLFALMAMKNLALTLQAGLGPRAASVFAMAAMVRRIVLDDPKGALELAEAAVVLDDRAGGTKTAEVLFLKGWFVEHWATPLSEILPGFDRGARAGRASGDVLYGCYNHAGYLTLLAASGAPLARVVEEADARIVRVGRRVIVARFHCVLERQFARALAGLTEGPTSLTDATFDESRDLASFCRTTNRNQVGFYHVARLKLHYYSGEISKALRAADEAVGVLESFANQPAEVDLVFFRALARVASGRSGDLELARSDLETLRRWRVASEANFGHKTLLVEAEVARVERMDRDAGRYLEAAKAAEEAGFVQHAALARGLGARHLARLGDDSGPMLQLAVEGYRAWGAKVLEDRLEQDQ